MGRTGVRRFGHACRATRPSVAQRMLSPWDLRGVEQRLGRPLREQNPEKATLEKILLLSRKYGQGVI